MTRAMKLIFLGLGIAGAVILFVLLNPSSATVTTGDYTIKDGHVNGKLDARFTLILDAEIIADDQVAYSAGKPVRADYLSHRAEIPDNIFPSTHPINAIPPPPPLYIT